MSTIYLVRHAQYENPRDILVGRLPVPLSEVGKAEAQTLASFFSDKNVEVIFSSPVARCLETSQIISGGKITITPDLRLAETFSPYQGFWELDWNHFYSHYDDLGGESPQDILKRVMDFWHDVTAKPFQNVVVCSHGDPLYMLFVGLTGAQMPDLKTIYTIPESSYQPKASVRRVTIHDGEIQVDKIIQNDQLLSFVQG